MLEGTPTNPKKSFATPEGEESLQQFPKPQAENDAKMAVEADLFATASQNLINEKMFNLFVRAITEKEISDSNDTLAFLQNRMIQECINLSEEDTDLVIKKFMRSVREWFIKKYNPSKIDPAVYRSIAYGINSQEDSNKLRGLDRGIKNVISFLKARARLLESNPAQDYNFYFSSKLDSRHAIDIIEETEADGETLISLIQLKSSSPTKEEAADIHRSHAMWVNEKWIDLEDYESEYVGPGNTTEVAAFLKNKETVEEALLDFCTDPEGQSLEKLLNSLHLSDLNHRQQAWVLWKYIDLFKGQLETSVQKGVLDEETKEFIWNQLSALKDKLVKKANLPKSQTPIKKVTSITSVGAKVFSQREIKVGGGGKAMNIR